MQTMNNDNKKEVLEFIKSNLDKSLFIYGNLNDLDSTLRFKRVNKNIIGLFLISKGRYITYLFNDDISLNVMEEIVLDAQNYKHIEGTVVNPNEGVFLNHYRFRRDSENITEVAVLKPKRQYTKSDEIEMLDYNNNQDIISYMEGSKEAGFELEKSNLINEKDVKRYIIKNDKGDIISSAALTSVSDLTGVIVGVFTREKYRKQGMAYRLIEHIISENTTDERKFYIFFENPQAKKIYLKAGFIINNTMEMIVKK